MSIENLKKKLPYSEIEQGYSNCALANERVRGYNDAIDDLHAKGLLTVWQPMNTAPKHEELFVCREKTKPHVQFEAMIFKDQESWEIPEEYDVLQNMTIDEPICDSWEDYEWSKLPKGVE